MTNTLVVPPPIALTAAYQPNLSDRRYIDDQARITQCHVADSLVNGVHCTWVQAAAPIAVNQAVQTVGSNGTTVTVTPAFSTVFGLAMTGAASAGVMIRVAIAGVVSSVVTGLASGGAAGYAVLNTGTSLLSYSATATGIVVGTVDAASNLTLQTLSGGSGTPGVNAFTTLTASFTVPTQDGATTATATVGTTGFLATGQPVFLAGAGTFLVSSILSGVSVALVNPVGVGTNAAAGTTISSGAKLTPTGTPGTGQVTILDASAPAIALGNALCKTSGGLYTLASGSALKAAGGVISRIARQSATAGSGATIFASVPGDSVPSSVFGGALASGAPSGTYVTGTGTIALLGTEYGHESTAGPANVAGDLTFLPGGRVKTSPPNELNLRAPAFGAVGDGVVDDSAAMAAWVAAGLALNGAGVAGITLKIPAGKYRFTSSVLKFLGATGLRVIGEGIGQSILLYDGPYVPESALFDTVSCFRCRFENFEIQTTFDPATGTDQGRSPYGVRTYTSIASQISTRNSFRNIRVTSAYGAIEQPFKIGYRDDVQAGVVAYRPMLTASFVMPAVNASVTTSAVPYPLSFEVGSKLAIDVAGNLQITGSTSTTITLKNLGDAGNAAGGTTIPSGGVAQFTTSVDGRDANNDYHVFNECEAYGNFGDAAWHIANSQCYHIKLFECLSQPVLFGPICASPSTTFPVGYCVVSMTSGSAVATGPNLDSLLNTNNWHKPVIGDYFKVAGAGAAGADLITTVASYTPGTNTITLAASAGTTVAAHEFVFSVAVGTTAGSNICTMRSGALTARDVGKLIEIPGAYTGAGGVSPEGFTNVWRGLILGIVDSTHFLINDFGSTGLRPNVTLALAPLTFGPQAGVKNFGNFAVDGGGFGVNLLSDFVLSTINDAPIKVSNYGSEGSRALLRIIGTLTQGGKSVRMSAIRFPANACAGYCPVIQMDASYGLDINVGLIGNGAAPLTIIAPAQTKLTNVTFASATGRASDIFLLGGYNNISPDFSKCTFLTGSPLDRSNTPTLNGTLAMQPASSYMFAQAAPNAGALTITLWQSDGLVLNVDRNITSVDFVNPPQNGVHKVFTIAFLSATSYTISWTKFGGGSTALWPTGVAAPTSVGGGSVPDMYAVRYEAISGKYLMTPIGKGWS